MAGALVPLANITLGGNQNAVSFSGISAAYKDLRLVITPKKTNANYLNFYLRFNNSASGSYERVWTQTTGSSLSGSYETQTYGTAKSSMQVGGSLAWYPTTGSSAATLDILDYSVDGKQKSTLERSSIPDSPSFAGSAMTYHCWNLTSVISSIQIFWTDTGSYFAPGSTFALYGVVG